jgi:hypothetical protein
LYSAYKTKGLSVVLPFSISKVHFPRSTIKMSLILRSVLHLSFLPLYSVGLLLVPYISIWPLGEIIMIIFPESTPILSPFFEDLKWTLRVFAYFAAAYTVAEVWFQVWEKPDTHRRGVLHIFEWPQSVSNPPSNRTTMRRPKHLRQFVHGFYLKFLSVLILPCLFRLH